MRRLKGRLANSVLKQEQMHSIFFLPTDNYFTKLIIWDEHETVMHRGNASLDIGNVACKMLVTKGTRIIKL